MTPEYEFRQLNASDDALIGRLHAVYDYYVHNSTATYHCITPDYAEFKDSLLGSGEKYPAYAIMCGEEAVGFAQLKKYIHRQSCDGVSAEVTLYIMPDYTGKGIGTAALSMLIDEARRAGLKCLCALVCSENTGSQQLFEKLGFTHLCRQHNLGIKFGRALGLDIYEYLL